MVGDEIWLLGVMTDLGLIKGPRGLDKILISPDGDITVTNDGATILSQVSTYRWNYPPECRC